MNNMTHTTQQNWPKYTIPVDAVLAVKTSSMNDFSPCPVLNISHEVLDILLDQPLDLNTQVTLQVHPEGADQRPYFVSGEVKQCGLQDEGWLHQIVASSERPWSPMFLYDVICSTFDLVSVEDEPMTQHQETHQPTKQQLAA